MRASFAPLAFAALAAATPVAQGVTSAIVAPGAAPSGCSPDFSGTFEIQVVNQTTSAKRSVEKRQDNALVLTLSGGILMDSKGRTGYIAANNQFQFDDPPQTGAIFTAGWSVCSNGSLALGDDADFFECLSGSFFNLYNKAIGAQCSPIFIDAIGASGTSSSGGAASQSPDGQITASPVASEMPDGQPTASPVASPICEFTDGQPQVTGCVSQISDGQIQNPTGAPVTQITDGQPQAPTIMPVTQITDGQPQAPTSVITQISDGQPQAPTNGTVVPPSPSVQPATGGAAGLNGGILGAVAGLLAVAVL